MGGCLGSSLLSEIFAGGLASLFSLPLVFTAEPKFYAVGTRMLAIAFGSELIALVAGARYPSPYGTTGTCGSPPRSVRVLPVFPLGTGADQVLVLCPYMLLEMLKGVV